MIIPELPAYLTRLGGGEYKGLIIALFTLTAGLSRPFSGKLADTVGRVPVMVVGATVSGVAALFYPLVSGVAGFMLLRLFHGFSTGFKPTGTSAYVADIIPVHKRGEAMGYVGFFGSLGMAAGPSFGPIIADHFSLNTMFYSSSVLAVLSVVILIGMKETLSNKQRLSLNQFKVHWKDIFEPKVVAPSIVMTLLIFAFGTIVTVIPDLSDHLGVSNRGMFYTYFTLASLTVRIVAGKASDKYGRVPVLKLGSLILVVSLVSLAYVQYEIHFVLSAVVYGIGVGFCSPTLFAWTIDLSDESHRGRGIATMYIALEMGIGLGALLGGWIYANNLSNLIYVFYLCAVLSLFAWMYMNSRSVKTLSTGK